MNFNTLRVALSHLLTSRAVVDKIELKNDHFKVYRKGLDEVKEWVALFNGFDPEKPQTWVSTGLKFVAKASVPAKVIEPPKRSVVTRYLESQGMVKVDQFNALTYYQDIVQKNFKKSFVVHAEEAGSLRALSLGDGVEPFYFYELTEPTQHRGKEYTMLPFLPDMVKFPVRRAKMNEVLSDLFWEDKRHLKVAIGSEFLDYNVVPPNDRNYEGELTELYVKLKQYRDLDVRRVVLFNGPPGTGKSTLALNLAEALSHRTIVMSHDSLEWISEDDWSYFLNMIKPEMVIVDDIDRMANMLQKKLFLFEETTCNVPLVVLTSNHSDWLPDAFKRPGRIDQIIEMETPGLDIRKEVVLKIASLEGVEVPEERIEILDAIHEKHSGAFIVELFRRVKVEGWDYTIPSYDRTFKELEASLRDRWNQGGRAKVPGISDLTLEDFED